MTNALNNFRNYFHLGLYGLVFSAMKKKLIILWTTRLVVNIIAMIAYAHIF